MYTKHIEVINVVIGQKTAIMISRKTHERLTELKKHPRQSYDEVVETLLDTRT